MKFRPRDFSKKYIFRNRMKHGSSLNHTYVQRQPQRFPKHYTSNMMTLSHIFGQLHHLAEHAPERVQRKYAAAYSKFMKHHSPDNYSYLRWIETYTAARWL
jgi:hypothetical protein